jgi:hypothetical protein
MQRLSADPAVKSLAVSNLTTRNLALCLAVRLNLCCVGAFIALSLVSCSNATTSPVTTSPGDLTPRTVQNLRPDSLARFLYFSFDSDTTVAASLANTDQWDIRLPFLSPASRSVDIVLNSGNVNPNGKTVGIMVDSTFDLLSTAPPESQLRTEDTSIVAGRRNTIIPGDLSGTGLFVYNAATRTISINPQRTLVLRTRSNKFVKVQFVNVYQNAVANPTMFTPLGFYTLRYVKSNTRQLR